MTTVRVPFSGSSRPVTSMALLDYMLWVQASRNQSAEEPLTLPSVQRSAVWRPRQILELWRSVFAGMPIGSFYLSRPKSSNQRRRIGTGGASTTDDTVHGGFDLLDGQQRTHSLLFAIDPPLETGRCIWVEALPEGIALHLTTRAQPFGYNSRDERLSADEKRRAWTRFISDHPEHEETDYSKIFGETIHDPGVRPLPFGARDRARVWPLYEMLSSWRHDEATKFEADNIHARKAIRTGFGTHIEPALCLFGRAEVALILAEPPENEVGAEWLLQLFDRIGAGGTSLSGPERLYSMYKHHVPPIHDVVAKITERSNGLLEPVEIARTAIRIASIEKKSPAFWEPSPTDFQKQIRDGGELRQLLDKLLPLPPAVSSLERSFGIVRDLLRYRKTEGDEWDIGLPAVLIGDLHPELLRILVYWAVLSDGFDISKARDDVVRFALFWHLCVTNDGKAAVNSAKELRQWDADGSFPWQNLVGALTGIRAPVVEENEGDESLDLSNRSALPLARPKALARCGLHDSASTELRSKIIRFERGEGRDATDLFHRWWWRSGMLLWLQRGYIASVAPECASDVHSEDDRPVDLDHIQPQAAYGFNFNAQHSKLPASNKIKSSFWNERSILGGAIGNLRWVPPDVNRGDGDAPIAKKLRLGTPAWLLREGKLPGARDGAIDPNSRDLWLRASSTDGGWNEDRILAWQQAVEERSVWLYERLWKEAEFDAWYPSTNENGLV